MQEPLPRETWVGAGEPGPLGTCHGPLGTCHGPLRGRCHVASGLCNALRGKKKWPEATKWLEKPAREANFHGFWTKFHDFWHRIFDAILAGICYVFCIEILAGISIFWPWREKRETWKSLESIVKTIVSWHVALCNNGTFSKTHGRKTQRKTPRKNFQNPCKK